MLTRAQSRTDAAGIVGRWQVDRLHEAHTRVLDEITKNHKKVIVFLGVCENLHSLENPLDYPTRAAMLQAAYPNVVCLPIRDRILDTDWSKDLDTSIRTVVPIGEVTLYGGRDSFVSRYSGRFPTIELDALNYASGTEIRKEVGRQVRGSDDFRAGIIYAATNRFPRVFMVVDIAIIHDKKILLGNKTGKPNDWGLPGGFVDGSDPCLEAAARREAFEETGILPESLEYQCSFRIHDRRMGSTDTMLSALFVGRPIVTRLNPTDIEFRKMEWFPVQDVWQNLFKEDSFVYKNHKEMILYVCEKELSNGSL
jgi:bifunctional NMN adenylyltransferase/nudix hydrolase